MKYSVAALVALAASASAWSNGTVYTTEVYTAYTTVCPASTQVTFNGVTYTATSSTTLTITNCPCTVVKPVSTSSVVSSASSAAVYTNGTTHAATTTAAKTSSGGSVGTTSAAASAKTSTVPASSGNKAFALSGASLAGILGFAAYVL